MKTNRGIHKALSMLLCCVMLLGLLPMTALAATEIKAIHVGIDEPTAGEKFDFTAEGSCAEYTVGNVYWYHVSTGEKMSTISVAQAGQAYEVRIAIQTKSGYYIGGNTVGMINGFQSVYDSPYPRTTYYVDEPPTQIYSVEVELDVPVPGAKPDFSAVCGDKSYTLSKYFDEDDSYNYTENGVQWIDATTKKVMDADDTFTVGHTYQAFIHLKKNGNYEFYYDYGKVPPVAVTVYGAKSVRTAKAYERDPFTEIDIICDFACDYQTISSVSITDLDAPKEGKVPDYSATLSEKSYAFKTTSASNPFVVGGISWHDETAGNDLTKTAKFIAGHTYTATVYLVPAAGYQFTGSVSGKINGNTATITGNGSEIQVKYTFPALPTNQITTVTIEGVTAPATGAAPSYAAIVKGEGYSLKARNDAYYKNGICWSVMESSDLPVSGGTTFEGGQKYQITMYLVAEDGYEFSATAGGALQVNATINGMTAAEVLGNKKEIVVTYYFTEATDEAVITSAAVTIEEPKLGTKPSFSATVPDGVNYTVEAVDWFCDEDNAHLESGDVYGAKTYILNVTLAPKDGYKFVADSEGLRGTINGQSAQVRNIDDGRALVTKYFPLESVTPFTDVKESDYYCDAVLWAVGNGITNGTSATTFSPDTSCTRAQAVTFLWRAAGTPEPKTTECQFTDVNMDDYYGKAVLWAVENGITNGTSATTFSPNAVCTRAQIVTFLWRSQKSPEVTTVNPFTDVAAGAYYAAAVLWAVDNAITNGTSAATFSPDAICARGQIVTFLWRYMSI